MEGLTLSQRRVLSDFFSSIAVGWFVAGVISPFLTPPVSNLELVGRVGWGLFMAYVFLQFALSLSKEGK